MTLQDMNQEQAEPTRDGAAGRKRPQDRRPKRSEAERAEREAIAALVRQARANGEPIAGPQGLLKKLTKMVLETSLEEEMTEHLGHPKHQPSPGEDAAAVPVDQQRNVRNGSRTKTVMTDSAGKVTITVPRDRAGTFEPVIVPKHKP